MPRTASSDPDTKELGASSDRLVLTAGRPRPSSAGRLGVSPAYVQKLEGGRANPTVGQLANVASALEMDLEISFVPEQAAVRDPFEELAEF